VRVGIQHRSIYTYPRPALLGPHVVRLRPADHARARIDSYRLSIAPEHQLRWQRDPHGNHVARVTFRAGQAVTHLEVTVELAIDVGPINPFDFFVDDRARAFPFRYDDAIARELAPFLDTTDPAYRMGARARSLVDEVPRAGETIDILVATNRAVNERVAYVIRDEPGIWSPEQTLENARGSCRDSATLLVAALRARGIAARFASGYLVQLRDEGMIPNEPRGVDRDVVDLHAWAEAYVPGAGWIGLDATSGLLCGEGHVPLACSASPAAAAPLDGTSDVAADHVAFATTIARLGHEPRPTAPYTDAQWRELVAAGDRADAALAARGLAITVGGEPTFTVRAPTGDEWQAGALGPDKWRRGQALALALRDRLAPGGVVLHRTGKHYPGESLPRWALDVIARAAAEPIATPDVAPPPLWPNRALHDDGSTAAAQRLGDAIAAQLGLVADLQPAYEDSWEVLRAEARLPATIDPRSAGLHDPEERRRLAAILDRGAESVVGWILPLAVAADSPTVSPADALASRPARWLTETWTFRRGHLFLLPGDSPIGLRLPLDSLAAAPTLPQWEDAPRSADPRQLAADDRDRGDTIVANVARRGDDVVAGIRTALAIEPRDGRLWVFMPPVPRFADFCTLVAAIDRARVAAGVDCHLEGYPPPPAADLFRFTITPDPGVIEVNVPPTASCRDAARLLDSVYETALASGLTAERYLLDGRAAGSGGGNHITIGAATPLASPWLARPDLLASLVVFAQHHPSLAYLFSGLFVGPTSQAPRVDEARHDSLYELEIALPALFDRDRPPPPWQVDALLRHLLIDVAGSTHRAEISIDKLFDPSSPFGRQGLVELRAFEMPPHPRMAAAQVTLVRALVAAFAEAPYERALARWGSELHDRFLLPYWLWLDCEEVISYARLPADAYRPFVELRCPLAGTLHVGAARVEVRNAIEPWHVLGEETTRTGTSRYVDSSVERIEIRTVGLDRERHVVTVNGVALPLRDVGGRDVAACGVRFRAWCPPHALHPHLGIHHPLRIDVIDTWMKRGVAGGAYHVWHPEGRAFDAAPLTRVEADARRAQRFTVDGPSPWPVAWRTLAPHADQPYTLDLRRVDAGRPMPRPEDWIR
jgi:uncharacterized protein (DUF2126 family)/transglutaminase-like putative cysteine protease